MTESHYSEEATNTLAFTNLDWSAISASILYRCIVPHLTAPTSLKYVKIYTTAYGKAQLAIEQQNGPNILKHKIQKEVDNNFEEKEHTINDNLQNNLQKTIKSGKKEKLEDNTQKIKEHKPQDDIENRYDEAANVALQDVYEYNNNKKQYYIAIAEFTTTNEAINIYNILDGMEIEESGNYIDLCFVPINYVLEDVVEECFKEEKYIKVVKKVNMEKAEWDVDTKRDAYIESLFEREDIDSEMVDNLIDISEDVYNSYDKKGKKEIKVNEREKDSKKMKARKNKMNEIEAREFFNEDLDENTAESVEDEFIGKRNNYVELPTKKDKKNDKKKDKKKDKKGNKSEEIIDNYNSDGELDQIRTKEHKKDCKELKKPHADKKQKKSKIKNILEKKREKKDKDDFKVDLKDKRFAAVFEDGDYNIDVTHKMYKTSSSLREIVKEKRNKYTNEE